MVVDCSAKSSFRDDGKSVPLGWSYLVRGLRDDFNEGEHDVNQGL